MRQYEVKVSEKIIKVNAKSVNEALNKAIDIWHKRTGLRTLWRPFAYILSSKLVK